MASIVRMITNDWLRIKTECQRKIMIKQARRARILMIFSVIITMSTVLTLAIPPCFGLTMRYATNITDPGRLLIFQTHYPYDIEKSPAYEITFIGQIVVFMMEAFPYVGIDNFMGLCIFHVCAQLETLAEDLTNFGQLKEFGVNLRSCVKNHIRLIRCVDLLENTFSIMLLGLLFYCSILLSCQGFLIVPVIKQGNNLSITRMFWFASATINVLLHTAIHCIVELKSEGIYRATCNNKWYELRPKEAICIQFLMLRTNRPLYITAGKMFPMTMATYCKLLKTSASYISFLVAYQD